MKGSRCRFLLNIRVIISIAASLSIPTAGAQQAAVKSSGHTQFFLDVLPTRPFEMTSERRPAGIERELQGIYKGICFDLVNRSASRDISIPIGNDSSCSAGLRFRFSPHIEAGTVRINLQNNRFAEVLLLFKNGAFLDSVVTAFFEEGGGRKREVSTHLEDVDNDGDVDLLRTEHIEHDEASGKASQWIHTVFFWEKDRFSTRTVTDMDPIYKKFIALFRSKIFNEPVPPSFVREKAGSSGYIVTLINGKEIELTDVPDEGDSMMTYRYVPSPLEPFGILFNVSYYEGHAAEYVDRKTGKIVNLPSEPIFSPSGERFVVAYDLEDESYSGGNTDGAFEVWRASSSGYIKEFSLHSEKGNVLFAGAPKWESETKISFQRFIEPGDGGSLERKRKELVFERRRWVERDSLHSH